MLRGQRRLEAIMFTDIAGFTALAQRDEALAMALLEEHRRLVRPLLAKHNGREVKTMGDAFLVEFDSSLDAVRCAIDIQTAMKEDAARRPPERRVAVRIGVHLGDVIHSEGDIAGDAVNVAQRMQALAPTGGICVSAQVRTTVANKVECTFESMGVPRLKNVNAPIEVFKISGFGEQGRAAPEAATSSKHRVAVIPFKNISPDPGDEYFADGLTEEMISSVSRMKNLRVIARTSVMGYKKSEKPIAVIGKELGVGSVLEGSVRKAGDRIRITVQLVDTSTEEPRWSEVYDRDFKDVFAIQSDVAAKVATALTERVLVEASPKPNEVSVSLDAYTEYLRGRQSWNRMNEAGLHEAIGHFQKALELDPGYASAHAGLADSYASLAFLEFMAPKDAYPRAKEAAARSLSLNPDLAEAHTSMALIKFQHEWDWRGAEEEFVAAIALNPSRAASHRFYSDYLKAMGRFKEAISEIERARELDPLSMEINTGFGHVLYLARRYDDAIAQYKKAVELDPGFAKTHIWFGRPYLEKGMYKEAITELQTAVNLSGESTVALAMLGHALASAGRKEEALRILERLATLSKSRYIPSYWIAVVYNGFKDKEQTIAWLRRAYDERSSWLVWSNVEPRFDWLRGDPEFASLMGAMKFPKNQA